ncbi:MULTISPECIES: hypothetical protein [unclassified Rhodanobacter]|jgi:hypothetical protein|uniref:hypothetical protein n=1 Tax=unclassified Rhodanobacter TaxID=2621553 RepID=UPI0012E3E7A9|nr:MULTISPECIES: hypothetical protein [unclassified Rhodanobacter]
MNGGGHSDETGTDQGDLAPPKRNTRAQADFGLAADEKIAPGWIGGEILDG